MTTMKRRLLAALAAASILLALAGACASSPHSASEREWARAECRQIIDDEARTKCMDRVDKEYGSRP